MEPWDEWLAGLENITGLSAEQLADVAQATDPAYAAIRARRLQEAENQRRQAERQAANDKATALLQRHLTAEQRTSLEASNYFDVISSAGNLFRIQNGSVYRMENGRSVRGYCIHIHPNYHGPAADNMLAQKLLIEHDEQEFLRIAH